MLRIVALGLCLVGLTGPVWADYVLDGHPRAPCTQLPPPEARQEPSVAFDLFKIPNDQVQKLCSGGQAMFQPVTACSIAPGARDNVDWMIVMSDFLSPTDYACVLIYEKAHLPPNDWKDQEWEDAGFKGTQYLKRQSVPVLH